MVTGGGYQCCRYCVFHRRLILILSSYLALSSSIFFSPSSLLPTPPSKTAEAPQRQITTARPRIRFNNGSIFLWLLTREWNMCICNIFNFPALFHPWCPGGGSFAVNYPPGRLRERTFFSSRGFLFPERFTRKLHDNIAFHSAI